MTDDALRIRVELSRLSMADLADALDASGVADLSAATGGDSIRATIAFAWVWQRRIDPTFTYADAAALPVGAIEVVESDADPNHSGADNGATPHTSPVSGISIPAPL